MPKHHSYLTMHKSVFNDDCLKQVLKVLQDVESVVTDAIESKNTVVGGCRTYELNYDIVRRIMYSCINMNKSVRDGSAITTTEISNGTLSKIEKLYCKLFDCGGNIDELYICMPKDPIETINYVIEQFAEKDREIMREYFVEDKTLDEVGKKRGYTREYIRQRIGRSILKLKTNTNLEKMKLGVEGIKHLESKVNIEREKYYDDLYEKAKDSNIEIEEIKKILDVKTKDISCLGLREHTSSVLRKNGITSVGQLYDTSMTDILSINSIGKVYLNDIVKNMRKLFPKYMEGYEMED